MNDATLWLSIQSFLGKEAHYLDTRQWDEWLALYDSEAEFWVPAWLDDETTTSDPTRQVSLIYCHRQGLGERVFRVREGRSAASLPFPRTCHFTNLLSVMEIGTEVHAHTSWSVNSYNGGRTVNYYGSAHYKLIQADGGFRIRSKKATLVNDVTDTLMDFYSI